MKVLLPFVRSGGVGSVISACLLGGALADRGIRVLASFPSEGRGSEIARSSGVEVEIRKTRDVPAVLSSDPPILSHLRAILRWPSMILEAFSAIRRHRPDVIHVNDDTTLLPWALAGRLSSVPVIWHVRIASSGQSDRLRNWLVSESIFISRFAARRCQFISKPKIIYNPIDLHRIPSLSTRGGLREQLEIQGRLALLFIGRDSPYKRLEWAIDCLKVACDQHRDVHLYILGNHKKERVAGLYSELAPNIRSRVHFRGFVERPEEYLVACDVFVQPAIGETLGRTYIEAAACSAPICAVASGGAAELLVDGANALLSEELDFDAFSGNCNRLLCEPDLRDRLARNAREWANDFSTGKHASDVIEVYREIGVKVDE